MSMRIGPLILESPLILAPMAGVTDLPFRKICREMGAALAHTEMVSAKGLVLGAHNTKRLLASDESDRPLSVQIFGSEPEVMAEAARICQEGGADLIDINMGCPVPKVVRRGGGAALLKDPARAAQILRSVRKVLQIPMTVKMRSGWTAGEVVAPDLARIAQDCGADALVIHARARSQGYGTPANWMLIRHIRETLSIPLIGNGDVLRPSDALAMREATKCEGVMIARGATGNPWIFSRSLALLEGSPSPPSPSPLEIWHVFVRHLAAILEHYGQERALQKGKFHLLRYSRGLPEGAKFRAEAMCAKDLDALESMAASYLCNLGPTPRTEGFPVQTSRGGGSRTASTGIY